MHAAFIYARIHTENSWFHPEQQVSMVYPTHPLTPTRIDTQPLPPRTYLVGQEPIVGQTAVRLQVGEEELSTAAVVRVLQDPLHGERSGARRLLHVRGGGCGGCGKGRGVNRGDLQLPQLFHD